MDNGDNMSKRIGKFVVGIEWDGLSVWIDDERVVEIYEDGVVVLRKGKEKRRFEFEKLFD